MNFKPYATSLFDHIVRHKKPYSIGGVLCGLLLFVWFLFGAPFHFPKDTIIIVEEGQSAYQIATELKEKGVVRSRIMLNNLIVLIGGERSVVSGEYLFQDSLNAFDVAKRITKGEYGFIPRKITIPEGYNIYEIADVMEERLPYFDRDTFLALAAEKEGYLFPDTYYFLTNTKAEDVIKKMNDTFYKKIKELEEEIETFDEPLHDIITMASIIEEEARQTETRKMVSGILWKRLTRGMPLQVDATFKYINGKVSDELTLDDLKIDSPYNTYVYKGLPPTPIANPGLDSIIAALEPTKSEYFYFLTDGEGVMHYAKTHDGHVDNKDKYLR